MNSLGPELRMLRKARKHSLRAVEAATGVSNAYISQLESGRADTPSPGVLYKLATFYGTPYETLLVAAGYLDMEKVKRLSRRPPTCLERILERAALKPAEEQRVIEYVDFVVGKRT